MCRMQKKSEAGRNKRQTNPHEDTALVGDMILEDDGQFTKFFG